MPIEPPTLLRVSQDQAATFAPLTFPAFRTRIGQASAIALGARLQETPVGLALLGEQDGVFQLLSLYVTPLARRTGIGTRLLHAAEAAMRDAGHDELLHQRSFTDDDDTGLRFAAARGWEEPRIIGLLCQARALDFATMPVLRALRVRPGWRLCGWSELDEAQRATIPRSSDPDARWPVVRMLDPFVLEPDHDPATSVALLRDGQVAGWVITHLVLPGSVRWTGVEVDPTLRPLGAPFLLWREAAARQVLHHPDRPDLTFTADAAQPMMQFTQRRGRDEFVRQRRVALLRRQLGPVPGK